MGREAIDANFESLVGFNRELFSNTLSIEEQQLALEIEMRVFREKWKDLGLVDRLIRHIDSDQRLDDIGIFRSYYKLGSEGIEPVEQTGLLVKRTIKANISQFRHIVVVRSFDGIVLNESGFTKQDAELIEWQAERLAHMKEEIMPNFDFSTGRISDPSTGMTLGR